MVASSFINTALTRGFLASTTCQVVSTGAIAGACAEAGAGAGDGDFASVKSIMVGGIIILWCELFSILL